MPLSCNCDTDWYPDPGDWYFECPSDYTTLREHAPKKKVRVRCLSCNCLIGFDDVVIAFPRTKIPGNDVEVAIYGDDGEIPIATKYHCETCADLYFSLEELGFCCQPGVDQRDLVKEYVKFYGPDESPEKRDG